MIPKLNSSHGSETRNIINRAIEVLNVHGKTMQDLVAEGQLTENQYAELIKYVNGLINENDLDDAKASLGATVNALIQQFNLKPLDDPIYIENLWNPEDTVPGLIDWNNGAVVEHGSYRTSNFTSISPNQNYTYLQPGSRDFRVVYFDSDQNYIEGISWISGDEPVTMRSPSNAAYQRITLAVGASDDYRTVPFYIVIGDYVPEGVKDGDAILYDGGFWENVPSPPLKHDSVNNRHLKSRSIEKRHLNDGIIDPEKTTFMRTGHNLIDPSQVLFNKEASGLTGEIVDAEGSAVSAPIPIPRGHYRIDNADRWVTYNSETMHIRSSGRSESIESTLSNTAVRINFSMNNLDSVQLYEGEEERHYEPFGSYIDPKYIKGISGGSQPMETRQELSNDTAIRISDYNYAELNFSIGRGSYSVHVSEDGSNFQPLTLTKNDSGTKFQRIAVKGVYSADVSSYSHLKYVQDFLAFLPNDVNIFLSTHIKTIDVDTRPNKYYAPEQPRISYELIETGGPKVTDLSKDGVLYGVTGSSIRKSEDYGVTWEETGSVDGSLDTARFLDNGTSFAISRTSVMTMYWLSDIDGSNWSKVYEHENQGIYADSYGFDIYQNRIIFSPYQGVKVPELIQIHYSNDYGETWKTIFDSPIIEQWHFHDVAYDPYQDRIYMVSGDSLANANTYWTDDEGETWQQADEDGEGRSQFTSINPIPGHVLFGTDESRVRGVFRHPRTQDITDQFVMDPAFHDMEPGADNKNIVIGNNAQYWDTNNATFFLGNAPVNVYATKDGFNYYTVLHLNEGRITNMTRVDDSGKFAMNYRLNNTNHLMLMDKLEWVEI